MGSDVLGPRCRVLLLRAWSETGDPAELRARLLVSDHTTRIRTVYVVGVDDVCDLVRQWLLDLTATEGSTDTTR